MESSHEIELIKKAINHDQNAYNVLFDKYWNNVFSFLFQRTNNKNLAEELAIESFSKAFDQLDRFDEKYSFKSWLITIAKNHHIDRYRRFKNLSENFQDSSLSISEEINIVLKIDKEGYFSLEEYNGSSKIDQAIPSLKEQLEIAVSLIPQAQPAVKTNVGTFVSTKLNLPILITAE